MNRHRVRTPLLAASLLTLLACDLSAQAARSRSDLLPPGRRASTVELATQLSGNPAPAKLPAKVVNPFNPPSWDAPDPEEARMAAEAAEAARRAGLAANRATSPRELLAAIAGEIRPTGVAVVGGDSILLVGSRKLRVGDPITATYGGKPFTVTITAIDRTSFTLRLNGEEYTRPIKSGNNP
ncbi:MAG: hypothetical protein JNN01_25805 [Opitutaceae bacterium]|nr:hypothetical protein [Opitutaceae bacterium]